MSRAFTKEQDGWSYCKVVQETCFYANEAGTCPRKECVMKSGTGKKNGSD